MNIKDILHSDNKALLKSVLSDYSIYDVCELASQLKPADKVTLFRNLDEAKAANAFSYLSSDDQQAIARHLNDQELMNLIKRMQADDSADFLEDMPENKVDVLLSYLDSKTRDKVNKLLTYEQETVGSIMNLDYVSLKQEFTVKEAFQKIRSEGINRETIYTCYVVDDDRKLIGIVSVRDMIMADSNTLISDLMRKKFVCLNIDDDQEQAAHVFNKYGLLALPVVDTNNVLVGIVTFDDVFGVIQEETTEDMQKMAGLTKSDTSYFGKSAWEHAKHRVAWLLALMITSVISQQIIGSYTSIIALTPIVAAFIPMLTDTGGNCGSQSSTLIIRGMTTDEIKISDVFKVIWMELRVALLVAAILAVVNGLYIYFAYNNQQLAIVVSLSLIVTIIVSKLVGSTLPILAYKLKLDPAVAASPLITTVVDIVATLIYFELVSTILVK